MKLVDVRGKGREEGQMWYDVTYTCNRSKIAKLIEAESETVVARIEKGGNGEVPLCIKQEGLSFAYSR